jgi:phage tail-like protein
MATYPLPKFHFSVEWGGARIGFTEATGLDVQTDVVEYREGNSPDFSKLKMPGLKKFSNVTLKRGTVAGDSDFYAWINTLNMNTVERRDVTIKLLNENHEPVFAWKVLNAFPVKYQPGDFNSGTNEVMVETLELAIEGMSKI